MGFKRDIKKGDEGEERVVNCFNKHGFKVKYNLDRNRLSDYDLICSKDKSVPKFTIEVKYDVKAQKTGNIAIEYYNPKTEKDSGILRSKATLWAYCIGESEIWITRTSELVSYIKNYDPVRLVEKAGDGNSSCMLYSKDIILPAIFFSIEELETPRFTEIINELVTEELSCGGRSKESER